jgi:type I restriction enzyme S subunit
VSNNLARQWTTFRLGNVCTKIGSGATPRGGSGVYLERGEVALIRSQNVYNDGFHPDGLVYLTEKHADELANVEVSKGDILLNITGDSVARACQVDPEVLPARVNQHVAIIRPDPDQLCPLFLRYFLVSPSMQSHMLSLAGAGATRNALTKGMIESFEVPAPECVIEQQAIACVLGTLDDKIELNRRRNRTLEAMARAIFQSWFVDFDPVKAKAAGKKPPGLKPELAAHFPDRFEDSPLGPIPAGWRVGTVRDNFRLTMGQSPPGETYNEIGEGIPFYQGRTDFGFRFPTRRVYCTAPTRMAEPGDTLVSVRAPVGDVNIAMERCAIGRGVAAVRHVRGSRSLTYYAMRNLGSHFNTFEAEGTVFGSINRSEFAKLPFIESTDEILEAFERMVAPLDDQVEVLERETVTLAALRDTLLPKLISGELRVPDAERIVGRIL